MKIDLATGLIKNVQYLASPNHDERPENEIINMIVIHNISLPPGKFGTKYVEQFFCNKLNTTDHPFFETIANLKVSSHLFIDRRGIVIQFVPFQKRAWHAGKSYFKDQECCNDFSIGIELEGTDHLPYDQRQYKVLKKVIKLLVEIYPMITRERIVGHSDIAPGRKTDPGPAFDWRHLDCVLSIE